VVTPAPGLFVGTLRHRRFTPRRHAFEYSLFMALIDIDQIPETMARSRWTGHNRWNWASFNDGDHLTEWSGPLRDRVAHSARAAGETVPDGPIYLLTHLRYGGYVFNPISIFYCHDPGGALRLVLAEVSNTYGGRRGYWLRPTAQADPFRARVGKSLYVSPFMEADLEYEFTLTRPATTLLAHMNVVRRGESTRMFDATLRLTYRPWTAATVRRVLLQCPWMTAKVIAAIHWQALRLRAKGVTTHPFPEGGPR
jgi:uncharacterized protein